MSFYRRLLPAPLSCHLTYLNIPVHHQYQSVTHHSKPSSLFSPLVCPITQIDIQIGLSYKRRVSARDHHRLSPISTVVFHLTHMDIPIHSLYKSAANFDKSSLLSSMSRCQLTSVYFLLPVSFRLVLYKFKSASTTSRLMTNSQHFNILLRYCGFDFMTISCFAM